MTSIRTLSFLLVVAALLADISEAFALLESSSVASGSRISRRQSLIVNHAQQQPREGENLSVEEQREEDESISEADKRLSDLLPPTVNFQRSSLLFSENPATQRNNPLLKFWRNVKTTVPPVITGAWPWRDPYLADEDPMTAFYNILFVRLPVIVMGLVYTKNLVSGHPLIMDYGDGPFEVSPLIVYGVLAIVLA